MKKLMIAAAAAAMIGGASAGLCDDVGGPEKSCVVYDVKVTMKTLTPKVVNVKASKGTACDDGADPTDCTYLVKSTKKFEGLIWKCSAYCSADIKDDANFILWETKRKLPVTAPLAWNGTEFEAGVTEFEILDRYGKKLDGVEAYWPITLDGYTLPEALEEREPNLAGAYAGDLTLAGFGKYNKKKGTISVSGNAVAKWRPECGGVDFYFCDDFDNICDVIEETDLVAASGTWSIKYNSSKSTGKKTLRQLVPANAQERDTY